MRRRHAPLHPHYAERLDDITPVQSREGKMIALGLAVIVTIITFTITSAVDTTSPPPAGFVIDADGRVE